MARRWTGGRTSDLANCCKCAFQIYCTIAGYYFNEIMHAIGLYRFVFCFISRPNNSAAQRLIDKEDKGNIWVLGENAAFS